MASTSDRLGHHPGRLGVPERLRTGECGDDRGDGEVRDVGGEGLGEQPASLASQCPEVERFFEWPLMANVTKDQPGRQREGIGDSKRAKGHDCHRRVEEKHDPEADHDSCELHTGDGGRPPVELGDVKQPAHVIL